MATTTSTNTGSKTGTVAASDLKDAVTNTDPKQDAAVSQTSPAAGVTTDVKDGQQPAPETPKTDTTAAPQNAPTQQAAKTEKTNTTAEKTMSVAAMYMQDYIKRYMDVNNGILDTPAKRKMAISCFQTIMMHALKNPTVDVLDQVTAFFSGVDTRDRVLAETVALQGIENFSKDDQMKMSIFYQVFYHCTDPNRKAGKKARPLNLEQARSVLKSDSLINYLTQKFEL